MKTHSNHPIMSALSTAYAISVVFAIAFAPQTVGAQDLNYQSHAPQQTLARAGATVQGQADDPYRVITFNVLVGFNDYRVGDPYLPGAERKQAAYEWLEEQQPDLVGLQEMNGYTLEELQTDAKAWGHDHAVLLKENGYDIALTAKRPIEVVERVTDGFHHGLLHCRVDGIDVFVTHFYPGKENQRRMQEMAAVLERMQQVMDDERPCLVMGDLNALSPQDDSLFGETARHWHVDLWQWPLTDGKPYYNVLQQALDAGLVDAWVKHRPEDQPQFPGRPRIDYVLASPEFAARSRAAEWVESEEMHKLSDHPPVVADFDWPE